MKRSFLSTIAGGEIIYSLALTYYEFFFANVMLTSWYEWMYEAKGVPPVRQ